MGAFSNIPVWVPKLLAATIFFFLSIPLASCDFTQFAMGVQNFTLPDLPYAYDALEPSISEEIMRLHHTRHHRAYVDNLNAANAKLTAIVDAKDVAGEVDLQEAIKFNGGGHINHSLFWKNLAPTGSPQTDPDAAPRLTEEIHNTWGTLALFKKHFSASLLDIKGSGWGWLVRGGANHGPNALHIITTKDQDPPIVKGVTPVFGVDMWEHAYYLQYQNGKAAYVENIWRIINWEVAEQRYLAGHEEVLQLS